MSPVESIAIVTRRLQRLEVPHGFLGGSIVPLLMDHPELHEIRPTKDVDAIVEVTTQASYAKLESRLRRDGFVNDTSEGAPICRYLIENCKVDVMPIDSTVLGLRSRWFREALASASNKQVSPDQMAPIIEAKYFLATKLEAFKDRGEGDYFASHDLEDLLAVVDGRSGIVAEVRQGPADLRLYLAAEFSILLKNNAFREALPGHFPAGPGNQNRIPMVLDRLQELAVG